MTMNKKLCGIFLLLLIPSLASALGLGKLKLNSVLNEPFDARIRLLSTSADELDSLTVRLAGSAAFARVNIDRPAVLSRLRFSLDRAERGADTIHITSAEPIREPFLNFLVEVSWSNGRLFREYTVLLDPPLYNPNNRITEFSPAAARPVLPAAAARINYSGGDYGPTVANETLWAIAIATRPSASISINRMMLALLRANPEAFIQQNINGLMYGRTLRMPSESEINALDNAAILTEVRAQNAAWYTTRYNAAAAIGERPAADPLAETVAEDTPVSAIAPAGPDSELRLISPNGADGMNQQVAMAGGVSQELILAQESIESLRRENLELEDRLNENEILIEDFKRLLSLKDNEMAALQAQLSRAEAMMASAEPGETAPTALPESAAVEQETPMAENGASDTYLSAIRALFSANPLAFLVGGGLLLVAIIVLLLRLFRGGADETGDMAAGPDAGGNGALPWADAQAAGMTAADTDDGAGRQAAPEKDHTDSKTGPDEQEQKTGPRAGKEAGMIIEDEPKEDPSSEVNTYLAFEQFDQAEKIARDAIAAHPDNPEFHIKLLEVFYTSGNAEAYEEAARALHELTGGEGEHWGTAMAMWSEMSPERPLFEQAEAEEQAQEQQAEQQEQADEDAVQGEESREEFQDITDVTPVGGLADIPADDAGLDGDSEKSAETAAAEAARARAEEALLDFDPAAEEKEGDISAASGLAEATGADEISPDQARSAEADADIELDLSEFDHDSKPAATADIDLDLSEFDDTPSYTTDATPHQEIRPEDVSAEGEGEAAAGADVDAGPEQPPVADDEIETVLIPRADQPQEQSLEDQIATQLDLARAYVEIGDKESATAILDEVMAKGNAEQKKQAGELSDQLQGSAE